MPRFAANLSLMFQEYPLLDRFAAAGDAGFTAVELQFPHAYPAAALAKAKEAAGVEMVLINGPVTAEHPAGVGGRAELDFAVLFAPTLDYVEALRPTFVNVLAGTVAPGEARDDLLATLRTNLAHARDRLAPLGATVLVEAINSLDVPGYLIDNFGLAAEVIEAVGGVGLQFDIYHAARMSLSPAEALAAAYPHVRHVQFADAPGRGEPGSGGLDFLPTLDLLAERGYGGTVAAEYRPSRPTAQTLAWLPAWRARYGAEGNVA
jgi:hydroxypyruvate isomerase